MDLSNYKLTFNEEFNSFNSAPDGGEGLWKTKFYFGGRSLPSNGEQQFYSDSSAGADPFSIQADPTQPGDHMLAITATPGGNADGLPYNSGLITTENNFSQTYGYFEMRAKLPEGKGLWPAFWMLPTDKSWPPEIDPLEAFGAANSHGEGGADKYHWGAIGGGGDWTTVDGNIYNDFHNYGVDWQKDKITYYFDGNQVGQIDTPAGFDKPMYMLANLAVGGSWAESPDGATKFPSSLDIDYIRAYSNDPNASVAKNLDPIAADTANAAAMDAATQDAANTPADHATTDHAATDHAMTGVTNGADATTAPNAAAEGTVPAIEATTPATDGATPATDAAAPAADGTGPATDGAAPTANGTSADVTTANGTTTATDAPSTHADGTLVIRAAGDSWQGDAKFIVMVDGKQVGDAQTVTASHAKGEWQDVTLHGDFAAGEHDVQVHFVNDAWGGTADQDRNLYVQSVDMNGHHLAHGTEPATLMGNSGVKYHVDAAAGSETPATDVADTASSGGDAVMPPVDGGQTPAPAADPAATDPAVTSPVATDPAAAIKTADFNDGHGHDVFVFDTFGAAPVTIQDFHSGEDILDIAPLLNAAGYEGKDPVADGLLNAVADGDSTIVTVGETKIATLEHVALNQLQHADFWH